MSKAKVMSVFGTRPEAIKMAPLVLALEAEERIEHSLVVTAQHRQLLDDVLELFNIRPQHDLDLMQERQSLEYIAARALTGLTEVFSAERPQFVLVHGDTTTTMAAALAAFYLHIPVGHVEAGLRTKSLAEPFPEELNRRVTDIIAAHYYCPTEGAAANLRSSSLSEGEIIVTGNTALDAVRLVYAEGFHFVNQRLEAFAHHPGPKIIVTAHRRENWGQRMESICRGILAVLDDQPDAMVCFCWHPNPVVRESVLPLLGGNHRVLLIDPPRFDIFVNLLGAADLVLTDSGGIQEEVTMLRRFALVLRAETERPEAVDSGFARLVGTDSQDIRRAVAESLSLQSQGKLVPDCKSPFGDGYAAQQITRAILERFAP